MKKSTLRHLLIIVTLVAALFTFGCQEKEGPAERLGEKVDEAVENSADAVEDAADEVEDAVNDTVDDLGDGQ